MNGPSESFYLVSFFCAATHVYCVKLNFCSKKTRTYSLPTFTSLATVTYHLHIEIVNAILIYHGIQFTFLMQTNWNLVSESGIILKRNHQTAAATAQPVMLCYVLFLFLLALYATLSHATNATMFRFEEIPDCAIQTRNRLAYHTNGSDYYDIQFNPSA